MNNDEQYYQELSQAISRLFQSGQNAFASSRNRSELYSRVAQNAKNDINRYGEILIPVSLLTIKHEIINSAPPQSQLIPMPGSFMVGGTYVLSILGLLDFVTALTIAFGERGRWKLFELLSHKDEDIATLAGMCFTPEEIRHPQAIPQLKTALLKAQGTACKLSLANSLMYQGDKSFIENLLKEYGLDGPAIISQLVIFSIATGGAPPFYGESYGSKKMWVKNRE